jgi:geranylgeranyl transferase type-2 subunit alpha
MLPYYHPMLVSLITPINLRTLVFFLWRLQKRVYNDATYALTGTLIPLNPDFYTLFNFRKEIVLDFIAKRSKEKGMRAAVLILTTLNTRAVSLVCKRLQRFDLISHVLLVLARARACAATLLEAELALTEKALQKQPKSYYAWYHRVWVIEQGTSGTTCMTNRCR